MHKQESRWNKEHISKTFEIVKRAKTKKQKHIRILDKSIYWLILFIAIIGNFVISIPVILFLLVLGPIQLYPVIIILGIAFGLLIEILIRNLEHLEKKHHIIFVLIIPLLGIS